MHKKEAKNLAEPIGEANQILRVLNFSGGGFDTVMQLGVTHALLVNQGKAPHVVVGVSAGAIQAAALAEIIRAGTTPDGTVTPKQYEEVLGQRVARFRQFADACHNAPQSIVDAVVPDAYQIDSFEPLAALRVPRLAAEEREERDEWIKRKTGLVHLYNDLLSIDLPFGAVTRLVRRWLGIKAAAALASRPRRITLRIVEFMRLWLVVGSELRRLTPAVPILVRPLVGSTARVRLSTAGSIIFKFRPVEGLWRFLNSLWSFLLLLNIWVVASWLGVLFPFVLVAVAGWFYKDGNDAPRYLYVLYFLYLLPIVLPLTPIALAYDKTAFSTALRDLSKGMFAFFYYLAKWTTTLLLLFLVALGLLQLALQLIPHSRLSFFGELQVRGDAIFVALVVVTLVLVVVRPLVSLIPASISFRRSRRKEKISRGRWYLRQFLDYYRIGPALAHNYELKRMLVGLFDPKYYGQSAIEPILSESLEDRDTPGFRPTSTPTRRTLGDYLQKRTTCDQKIVVAVATADVGDGRMTVMPHDKSIVDSLLAATAFTPVFPPVRIDDEHLLIDAYHVGNMPTKALVELLQEVGLADVVGVHIYAVDPLPVSQPELGPYAPVGNQPYMNLIDIVMRALQLQRFRDASIERKLTDVISDAIPPDCGTVVVDVGNGERKFFRTEYVPVELQFAPNLNRRIMFGDKGDRRVAIQQTVASGCRASLEVMHAEVIAALADDEKYSDSEKRGFVRCQDVIEEVNRRRKLPIGQVELPGSSGPGPGLAEVCQDCQICDRHGQLIDENARQALRMRKKVVEKSELTTGGAKQNVAKVRDWPHELEETSAEPAAQKRPKIVCGGEDVDLRVKDTDTNYPSIACLFSGGVFRGVFQLGVLNALSLLRANPRIVAGASIGSITAAMVASVLAEKEEDKRQRTIAKLAAAYVGIDRIILTDRFADFVRNWTIRASEAKFSLRQVDRVFRKYDEGRSNAFRIDIRQVLAGIERLFYFNPYQVNRITNSIRNRHGLDATNEIQRSVQQWLDRMGVGEEILGAESIRLLIEEFVIPAKFKDRPASAPFNCLNEELIFLATVTNLTKGRLTLLSSDEGRVPTTLIEGLLASSAFPAVFRPRRSWDLQPGTNESDQYIDGGVMDNLPLDQVLQKFRTLADQHRLPLRSQHGPHLMLAASLEVDAGKRNELNIDALENYWPELSRRGSELKYNTKLDNFERVASNLQSIYYGSKGGRVPLSVKVVAVKPRWLCNTFSFHPMLGFRRQNQVRSIAHGCAATLIAFGKQEQIHIASWRLRQEAVSEFTEFDEALTKLDGRTRSNIRAGECWLQRLKCPFSAAQMGRAGKQQLDERTMSWLSRIHESCWERSTHVRQ